MCGIIGYVGKKNAVPIILEGLKNLEYRGYDSAGVSVINSKGKIETRKEVGVLAHLCASVKKRPIAGTIGIGHTRWATHGIPSQLNCHPHSDSSNTIKVVHNGIIENFKDLKDELISKGHFFKTETDTEVIPHLIEEELKKGSKTIELALRKVTTQLQGSFALGIFSLDEPHKLIAVRQGSPLIIGVGKDEHYISSDVYAIMDHTRKIIYLNDGEIIVLTSNNYKITDFKGRRIEPVIKNVTWDKNSIDKGGYEKYMLKEIHEQPTIIRQNISIRVPKLKMGVRFDDLGIPDSVLKNINKVYIVSCGTAYYAGYTGKYLLEHFTSLPVETDLASEFRYRKPKLLNKNTLIVAVSQSGETADTLASIREAKEKGCRVLAICNVVGSTLTRESDGVIYINAGPEISVASTKAYTAQLLSLYLFTIYLARLKNEMSQGKARKLIKELQLVPDKMEEIFRNESYIINVAKKYHKAQSSFYLGRGFNYPNALEGALKNKEISYMHAEGYAAGEMKHGPIALIDKSFPVICLTTKGSTYDKMISNIKEVEARKGRIIALATEGDKGIKSIAETVIYVPETMEEISPLINIIPLQLLAFYIAEFKGCDIDKPRNLAKSVTVE
ncbi:MAG: glutamine--fructose-6-phosphate transaminase (isomerizing) [Candidatus Ancaeobacter aquaticus]|nr:glutamine--fructose-6-phosphate transaminase (isomerizing) [Candidatus Ancaeobacter aquaticus]